MSGRLLRSRIAARKGASLTEAAHARLGAATADSPEYDRRAPAPGALYDEEAAMPKTDGVYRVIEVIGTSTTSWEEAAKKAVQTASRSLRDLRIAEVVKMDMKVENGRVAAYRTRVMLSFKYEK
jgi:dodecin